MKYIVTINLQNNSLLNKVCTAPYWMSNGNDDTVKFEQNKIVIEAERSKLFTEDKIFFNVQNSLYTQIFKILLYHYAINGSNAAITSIVVEVFKGRRIETLCTKTFNADNQPLPLFDSPVAFDVNELEFLLQESKEAFELRIILAHWLFGARDNDKMVRLECYWRAFERLCAYLYGKHHNVRKIRVIDSLRSMVTEFLTYTHRYPCSEHYVTTFTKGDLRKYLWHDMISNNYREGGDIQIFQTYLSDLVDLFTDERVIQVLYDTRVYRKRDFTNHHLLAQMETTCTNKLATHTKKDIDIVAIICCHYAYYLRNRLFHGESLVRSSIFNPNADGMSLDEITGLLMTVTVELINNFSRL